VKRSWTRRGLKNYRNSREADDSIGSVDIEKAFFEMPKVGQEQTELSHACMYVVFAIASLPSTTEESPLRLEE
jgi:hypothetical protein